MAGSGQTTHTFTGDEANYSHDFQNQISNYTNKANEQYNQYGSDRSAAQNYENAYNEAFNNRQMYGDYMNQAEGKYGVEDAKNTYQNSLRAVAATNQAMSALPSTTNANSGVVLNQAQRNAALSNQMNKYQNTLASWQQQNAVDQSALNVALQQAAQLAAGNYQSQQDARIKRIKTHYNKKIYCATFTRKCMRTNTNTCRAIISIGMGISKTNGNNKKSRHKNTPPTPDCVSNNTYKTLPSKTKRNTKIGISATDIHYKKMRTAKPHICIKTILFLPVNSWRIPAQMVRIGIFGTIFGIKA